MNRFKILSLCLSIITMASTEAMENSPEELAEKYTKDELVVQLSDRLQQAGEFFERFLLPAIPPKLHKEINCLEKALELKKNENE